MHSPSHWLIVVSVGRDSHLLNIRSKVLSTAGFASLTVSDLESALKVLEIARVDGAIICHTFRKDEQEKIRKALRDADPGLQILNMKSDDDNSPDGFLSRVRRFFRPEPVMAD